MTSKLFLHNFIDPTKVISFLFSITLLRSWTEFLIAIVAVFVVVL